ncbi:MAG: ester cyclase, partial [Chloroflexi bacterium]
DDHAIAWGTRTGEANGKKLSVRFVHIQRIRDGKIVESWMFTDDQYNVDDFYS